VDISTTHNDARIAVCREPSIIASLALLVQGTPGGGGSTIALYGTSKPAPGADPGAPPVVAFEMTEPAGTVDTQNLQIVIDTPLEGQVTGADPALGTIPIWGRITTHDATWWADVTVTVYGDGGEIQLSQTGTEGSPAVPVARLYNGAFARLTEIIFQG
jgi:hypothetical protein